MREWTEEIDFAVELMEATDTVWVAQINTEHFIYLIELRNTGSDNLIIKLGYEGIDCSVVFDDEVRGVLQSYVDEAMEESPSDKIKIEDNTTNRVNTNLDLDSYTLTDDYL